MEKLNLINELKNNFEKHIFEVYEDADILTLVVDAEQNIEIIAFLKDKLGFIFLTDLCGVHFPDSKTQFAVVYHLHNLEENFRLRIKCFLNEKNIKIRTLISVFSSANWMERETYDFYGIDFVGHPNLIRILNVEYLDYFPLRKEYALEDQTRLDKDDKFFGR